MFELELLCACKEGMLLSMKLYAMLRWRLPMNASLFISIYFFLITGMMDIHVFADTYKSHSFEINTLKC